MSQGNDRTAASGLLHELDDIRSLLDDALPDDAIPVLEDAVEIVTPAPMPSGDTASLAADAPLDPADLESIPLLQDAIAEAVADEHVDAEPIADDEAFADPSFDPEAVAVDRQSGPAPFPPGATVAELLAAQELQTAIRNRIDATFERWLNDTLQQELNLLRARLLEAVRAEVHEFIAHQINRDNATGRPHGE